MPNAADSKPEIAFLFDRHDRAWAYFLQVLILLVCLHANIVGSIVWYVIALQVLFAVGHQSLINVFQRFFGETRPPVPVFALDAFLVGLSIAVTQFSVAPTFVFASLFVLSLIGHSSPLVWMVAIFTGLFSVFFSATLLGFDGMALRQSPVLVSTTALSGLMLLVILEVIQSRAQVARSARTIEEAQAKTNHFMHIANKIARYVPIQVWQSIVRGDRDAKIENKRKKLTIFFSDIQGFTDLSETLLPDDLAAILNTYFERMSDIAKKYGGTIDKFIGDALLIFFGDPTTEGAKADAIACIEMAIAMRRENKLLRQKWKALGFDGLHVRMGVTTGYCHVGNFGSNSRMSYTIIGRDANLAARLQTAADPDEILISNDTYLLIRDKISCRERGLMQLKGIAKPMQTWQVIDKFDDTQTFSRRWVEYELDGFNLQLDMDEVKGYDRERILQALQQVARNIDEQKKNDLDLK